MIDGLGGRERVEFVVAMLAGARVCFLNFVEVIV